MSSSRTRRLLRLYPQRWRQHYGPELEALIEDDDATGLATVRRDVDVATAAVHERLSEAGLVGSRAPSTERARSNALMVLAAWVLFVPAGVVLQRISEHWDAVASWSARRTPSVAFTLVQILAAVGSVAVVVGGVVCARRLHAWARTGDWRQCRRQLTVGIVSGAVALVATAGVLIWVHVAGTPDRSGSPPWWHVGIGLVWGTTLLVALATGARAVVAVARRLDLGASLLRAEVWLAMVVAVSMLSMSVASLVWWISLPAASRQVVVIGSGPAGDFYPPMAVILVVMVLATALAVAGAVRARAAVRGLAAA